MPFFARLIADAQPKADKLATIVSNIGLTKPCMVAKGLGYNTLVTVVGVPCAVAAPTCKKVWARIEKLAEEPAK